jgi:transposase
MELGLRALKGRNFLIPGVGPAVSLAFAAGVDIPARFKNSKAVGSSLGPTSALPQSGESLGVGHVSLCGRATMGAHIYAAAQVVPTRVEKWSWLQAWAMYVAKRRGLKRAVVALERRTAATMHPIWVDGTALLPIDS